MRLYTSSTCEFLHFGSVLRKPNFWCEIARNPIRIPRPHRLIAYERVCHGSTLHHCGVGRISAKTMVAERWAAGYATKFRCLGLTLSTPICKRPHHFRTSQLRERLEDPRMWEDNRYFWVVVLCKNRCFHYRESGTIFFGYRIPLRRNRRCHRLPYRQLHFQRPV
jgi:hypothetical protein